MNDIEFIADKHVEKFGGWRSREEKEEVIGYIRQHEISSKNVTDSLIMVLCTEYRQKMYMKLMSNPKVIEAIEYLRSKGFTYEDFQRADRIYNHRQNLRGI